MQNITYHIICEGKSEENYLNLLNKFFCEEEIKCYLKPYSLDGLFPPKNSPYAKIIERYKEAAINKNKPSEKIIIWLDDDVFKYGKVDKEQLKKRINKEYNKTNVEFFYSYENFEDFFIMHFDDYKV